MMKIVKEAWLNLKAAIVMFLKTFKLQFNLNPIIVGQFRAGAPDKIRLWHLPTHDYIMMDNKNLSDMHPLSVEGFLSDTNWYLLPADEADIKYCNEYLNKLDPKLMNKILLPRYQSGKVIDYDKFVPKNAPVYDSLERFTGIIYPKHITMSKSKFIDIYSESPETFNNKAIKVVVGSGSRGVVIVDSDWASEYGGKCVSELTKASYESIIDESTKQGDADIMIQELSPKLDKCNIDFIIKDGKLLSYKWDKVNPKQIFTNWDSATIINNSYTDMIMDKLVAYLTDLWGIHNAIMNFECFSDLQTTTYMVEFNWRYSNPMFEYQALGTDVLSIYFSGEEFSTKPFNGEKLTRYWQCTLYRDIVEYN